MTRWGAFTTLCGYLRRGLLGGPAVANVKVSWPLLINASSRHLVTPALAWCLREQSNIPSDVRSYFDAVLMLNAERNNLLLRGLERVVGALNSKQIEPVLLKGIARLLDGSYPAQSLRFVGDLDLLIPPSELASAAAVLQKLGFAAKPDDPVGPAHHHLPMLHDQDSGVGVELHRDVVLSPLDAIVPTSWFYEHTRLVRFRNCRVRAAAPTQVVTHNIVHDQLLHFHYEKGSIELRQLLDFALLRARHEASIDWREIDRRFCDTDKGQVLSTYMEFGSELFGLPVPQLKCASRPDAVADFKRRMRTGSIVRGLARDYWLARRRAPLGVIRLFSLRTWTNRLRVVKSSFDDSVI